MFENVSMLAGLGGAVVPLVIHLLGRARYRTVDWGAMMFFDAAGPRYRDGTRLREWALLGVRMAAVGLLALALARPTLGTVPAPSATPEGEPRVAAAIVVDCSASMAYEEVGGSRMDAARSAALQVLSTLRRGDRAALIPAGAGPLPASPQLTSDLQSLASRVSDLRPASGSADLPAAIDVAAAALARQDRVARQLYVITDRQSANWRHARAIAPPEVTLSRFVLIPVGGRESENVAVDLITLRNPPAVRGAPADVEVRVRNYGPQPRRGLPMSLRLAGRDVFETTLNVPADGLAAAIATVTFPAAGSQVLTARIRGGGPSLDDVMNHVVEVSEPLRVLLVREEDDAAPGALVAALAPYQAAGRDGADLAAVETLGPQDWDEETDLSAYQVIVLDNVPIVSPGQAAALEQFVYAGGGLLMAPGPASRTNEYNRLLYREDDGLLPALLQPPASQRPSPNVESATLDLAHPTLHFLWRHGAPLSAIVDTFFPITARVPTAHAVGSLTTGDPFLVTAPYGRGQVVLVTCSLRPDWSTLPLTSLYLPLVQSTTRFLASSSAPNRNARLGEELVATLDSPLESTRGIVVRPDGTRDTCDVARVDGRSEIRYARTDLPGLYVLRAGPRGRERSVTFSVAAPVIESDLTPLSDAQWQELTTRYGFAVMEPDERPLAARLTVRDVAGGEWIVLLGAVLGLLVLELGLTRLWSAEGEATR